MIDLSIIAAAIGIGAPFATLAYFYGQLNQKVNNLCEMLTRDNKARESNEAGHLRTHTDFDTRLRGVEKVSHPYQGVKE